MAESLIRIIIDTDLAMGEPGAPVDDGFALALAIADPELRLELVTTIDGNSQIHKVTRLTTKLLGRLDHPRVAVVPGAAGPINPAAAEIVARVMAEPGELTIVAIGPLTNIARALQLEPRLATSVREIVVMGGVFLDQTRSAEYNFKCDPEAAQVVLDSGAQLRMVGLDVTEHVTLTRSDADWLAERGEFGRFAAKYTVDWIAEHKRCALHDPLAVAVVTRSDLVSWQDAYVAVEIGPVNRGAANADLLAQENPPEANCQIATKVDANAFRELFFERMAEL